jgi:serine/threonine-protein kinase RsbW
MTSTDRVSVTLPPLHEFARTARVLAAELATRVGMDIDRVDDMKLAVEEAFIFASQHAGEQEVTLTFELSPSRLSLVVGPLPSMCETETRPDSGRRYADFILSSVCDEFEICEEDGTCFLRLSKSAD